MNKSTKQLEEITNDESVMEIEESKEETKKCNQCNFRDIKKDESNYYQKKNKCKLRRIENGSVIPINLNMNEMINICTGLFITNDGVIRLCSSLDQVSFGFNQSYVQRIEENKALNIVDISLSRDKIVNKNYSLPQILSFLHNTPHSLSHPHSKYAETINQIQFVYNYLILELNNIQLSEYSLQNRENNYQKFIRSSFKYIENYIKENPNTMFKYKIQRVDYRLKDFEITHSGYSKSYLDLIGLDSANLNQLIQRNKKIDLIEDKSEISYQSLIGIQYIQQQLLEYTFISNISTFDGFKLKLIQKQKLIDHSFLCDSHIHNNEICEYQLVITEMDVDLNDLQSLILYRQRIASDYLNLSIQDYLRVELSYLFEDVEYSISSQSFIDKFYPNNITKLTNFQSQKINLLKQCKYRCLQV